MIGMTCKSAPLAIIILLKIHGHLPSVFIDHLERQGGLILVSVDLQRLSGSFLLFAPYTWAMPPSTNNSVPVM